MKIKDLREKINKIDIEILDLLKERFALSSNIAKLKKEDDSITEDSTQEKENIRNIVERGRARGLNYDFIRDFFEEVNDEASEIENEK